MTVMSVGIRELKNKLSEYLRCVKAGETIIVTEHGKTIGQIIPVKPTVSERINAMIAAGQADWNGQKLQAYEPKAANKTHLTTALIWQETLGVSITMVTFDRELWQGANKAGLATSPEILTG